MKKIFPCFSLALVLVAAATTVAFKQTPTNEAALRGAWQLQGERDNHVVIFTDAYFSYAHYNKAAKQFRVTFGGTYRAGNGAIVTRLEFHSSDSSQAGKTVSYPFTLSNDVITATVNGKTTVWKRLDDGTAPLADNWRITHRMQDGKLQAIHQSGGRKTVKILSGTRFQWAAINTDTKEFSGTGGGTYTFQNGKYTEHIEFFSRDNSRVGASLTFDGNIKSDGWHHSGLSSRGDTIYEVWNKTK